jgi:hypothetical protein
MKRTRSSRSSSWFLGAAIVCCVPLAGCDDSQSSGPMKEIPKESPVLTTGKESAQAFFGDKKAAAAAKAPSKK